MDRIDRLIVKTRPKPTITDILRKDNKYMGCSKDQLLQAYDPDHYAVPERGTLEYGQFMFALISAQ